MCVFDLLYVFCGSDAHLFFHSASVQTPEEWVDFSRKTVNLGVSLSSYMLYISLIHPSFQYHSIGSASMLPKKQNGVVNQHLQVYGSVYG